MKVYRWNLDLVNQTYAKANIDGKVSISRTLYLDLMRRMGTR